MNRNRRALRGQIRQRRTQFGQDRIHQRGDARRLPCSTRRAKRSCAVTAAITASTCARRPGDHGLARRNIHRQAHPGVLGDQRRGGLGIQFQQRHRTLAGQPRHQPRPGRDHLQPVGRAQRPGHHRRGHLPHRMPDHRIGFHPVGPPQRGQRQLQPHDHRLHPRIPAHRFTVGQHLLQRKPDLLNEHRLQLGDRRRERRLIGQQLPAHPRPLRTLTRIHEHRARSTQPLMRRHHPGRRRHRRPVPAARPPPERDHAHTPRRTFLCRVR